MGFSFAHGLPVALGGAPVQAIDSSKPVTTLALVTADHPTVRARALVAEGDRVCAGDGVARDRRQPELVFTAPVAGRIERISHDAGQRLVSIVIGAEGADARRFDLPHAPDGDAVRRLLLEAGLWPCFTARPFGRIPPTDARPDAIFVSAADTRPLAADPRVIVSEAVGAFARGCETLTALTEGPLFLIEPRGAAFARGLCGIHTIEVGDHHPDGLVATHLPRVFPLVNGRTVWQIACQDVIAIGRLMATGRLHMERVVSLAGPCLTRPRLVRTVPGAALDDLIDGELIPGPCQILSGSPLDGRERRYLGRDHWQVTVLRRGPRPPRGHWWNPRRRPTRAAPVIPTAAIDRALPQGLPAMALLRALSLEDSDTARHLGCLSLLEEDMALASYAAGGVEDFAARLRTVLNDLERRS